MERTVEHKTIDWICNFCFKFAMKIRWFILFALTSTALTAPAQNFTNLAGILNGIYFQVPTQLTATETNGRVIDVPQSSSFGSDTFEATIQDNGTFTGNDSGTISIEGQGMITIHPSTGAPISMRINSAQDAFIGLADESSDSIPQNSLNLGLRAPQTVDSNSIAGNWSMAMLDTPERLIQVLATNGALTDLLGRNSNSVDSGGLAQIGTGSMMITSSGTLSGIAHDPFTGSYVIGTNGEINVTINSQDTFTMPAFINASNDVMIALHRDDTNNDQQVILMVKTPAVTSLADLKGVWQVTSFSTPSGIVLSRDVNNYITSISLIGSFDKSQSSYYAASSDGFVSGSIDGHPSIGLLSVGEGGAATITFTNDLGETQSHSGYLNTSKNCIIVAENNGDTMDLTIVTKAPDWPGNQNVGLQSFPGYGIVWAGDTNLVLQSVNSLDGSWTDIPSTLGQNQYDINPTNSVQFYRVKIQ